MINKQNTGIFTILAKVSVLVILNLSPLSIVNGQNRFIPGEELRYSIYFGPINAGVADVKLVNTFYGSKRVFHSKVIGRSTGLADKIYKVYDTYECYFDSINILPVTSIRDIREGRYRKKNIDSYNHQTNIISSGNKGEIQAPKDIRDIVSAFYYFRNYNFTSLKKGDIIKIEIFFDDELITFRLYFIGKEHIETKMGEFDCLKFIPEIAEKKNNEPSESISPTPEDDMILWISDDPNHVPIRVKFDLFIGSIKCDLIGYQGLKY